MADFSKAQAITAKSEGGYSNDAHDTGGQTVFGLTRRDWPKWSGWATVDAYLKQPNGITKINADTVLKSSAEQVFKANYWDVIKGDLINDQQVASQAYDAAINMGTGTSAKMMQQAAGVNVDRVIGSGTLAAINSMDAETFYNKFIALRRDKYLAIIANDPSQVKFKASWFSRLTPYKR